MKHAPEPWDCKGGALFDANGTPMGALDLGYTYANSARIVACINACAGIEDPENIAGCIADLQSIQRVVEPDNLAYLSDAVVRARLEFIQEIAYRSLGGRA